jgi:hypothetical protein
MGGRRPTCQGHQVIWKRAHKGQRQSLDPTRLMRLPEWAGRQWHRA